MKKIGFVGLGVMGASMVRNLMKHGFEVHGYARHPKKAEDLVSEGLILHDSLADTAKACDLMISMVGFPDDVREIYYGKDGILENLGEGKTAIDMTTSDPELAAELAKAGKEKGIAIVDAPVTGGDLGAKNGTLTILVGCDEKEFENIRPVLEAMGSKICWMGTNGMGQQTKLVNQILIAGAMAGVAEAYAYAKEAGLNPETIYDTLKDGAAGSRSLDLYWQRIVEGDMKPGFFIKHFIKDMNLARKQAAASGQILPVLDLVLSEYQQLNEPDLGTQALVEFYEKQED